VREGENKEKIIALKHTKKKKKLNRKKRKKL
jgi:hypothetical protein